MIKDNVRLKYVPVILFLLLVTVSLMNVMIKLPVASELKTEETKDADGRVIRIDYTDDSGRITTASDRQYATVIRTYEDSKMVMEEYLDSRGKRTRSVSGYSVLRRTYNAEGRADTDTYYDKDGDPVRSVGGVYGYRRIYDADGRGVEGDYIDESGQLMNNKYGIAVIRREFYDDGRVKRQFYFDKEGTPEQSSAAQYGEYREYDEKGKLALITYLDAEGKPMRSNMGYVTARNRYDADGKLYEVTYYDEYDKPTTGKYRQYGERYIDGQTIFLDSDGQQMRRLDNFLNTHPAIVIVLGVLIMCLAMFVKGSLKYVLIVDYILFILFMTLWFRETGDTRSRFDMFWSYRQFLSSPSLRQSIINNIWLFVPLGALLYKPGSKRFLIPIILSVVIEVTQYVTGIELCELDNVFSNGLGGMIGYSLVYTMTPRYGVDGSIMGNIDGDEAKGKEDEV